MEQDGQMSERNNGFRTVTVREKSLRRLLLVRSMAVCHVLSANRESSASNPIELGGRAWSRKTDEVNESACLTTLEGVPFANRRGQSFGSFHYPSGLPAGNVRQARPFGQYPR